jgi:hypothetical protein
MYPLKEEKRLLLVIIGYDIAQDVIVHAFEIRWDPL